MLQQTPLIECHRQDGAKLVDFSGWKMPIHYGSQVEEHHQVRNHAGLFDVSHMTLVDVSGPDQMVYLKRLLANDIDRLDEGRALYTAMLNAEGGIIDDLIVYRRENDYRLVVNCATKEKDVAWMRQHAEAFDVSVETPSDYAIIAVQGPESRKVLSAVLPERDAAALGALKPFSFFEREGALFARTGYTGESGFECIVDASEGVALWQSLRQAGASPIGLGARDTLRLEAGMNLYGQDLDETVCPAAANLSWTVVTKDRDFIGQDAMATHPTSRERQIGVQLVGKGVLRAGYPLFSGDEAVGVVTSGAFSPTLACGIGLARVRSSSKTLEVEIRGKRQAVEVVPLPFVPRGQFN